MPPARVARWGGDLSINQGRVARVGHEFIDQPMLSIQRKNSMSANVAGDIEFITREHTVVGTGAPLVNGIRFHRSLVATIRIALVT